MGDVSSIQNLLTLKRSQHRTFKGKNYPVTNSETFGCSFHKAPLLHCLAFAKDALLPLAFGPDPV